MPILKAIPGNIRIFLDNHKTILKQHVWAGLALTAISLAFFAGVDYGNTFGGDDWFHFYLACQVRTPIAFDRPLSVLLIYGICPFLGTLPIHYHLALLTLRAIIAFLIYLLIWQISPSQSLFAFSCAAAAATLLIHDSWFIFTLLQQTDHILSVVFTLLGLNFFVAFTRSRAQWYYRILPLGFSLLFAALTPLVREATFPILFSVPILLTILDWDHSWPRLIGLALWSSVILLGAVRFIVALRTSSARYAAGTFKDLNLPRMLGATQNQLDIAFRSVFQLSPAEIAPYKLAIFIAVFVTGLCFLLLWRLLPQTEVSEARARHGIRYFTWTVIGILLTWLGIAPFLPTIYANSPSRTHVLAIAGEAITLMGAGWFLSGFTRSTRWRALIQVSTLVWITAHGTVFANLAQQELYGFVGTWDNSAYFFRSLAHLAPALKNPVLFVYMENPQTGETPFASGWSFQYGLRYLYQDQATGLMPTDSILGSWNVSDSGIWMSETAIAQPRTYPWDQVIFITRDTQGHIFILDKLPERFLTAYRQSLYRPYASIVPGFIPPRLEQTFPILAGPDWKSDDSLSH